MPFRFNLHVSDLGHTLIVGPPGVGKLTSLGLIAAQWFCYRRAQVFAFDRGYSIWMLTEVMPWGVLRLGRAEVRSGILPVARNR
jgi:type IV secretion system protein VirB4